MTDATAAQDAAPLADPGPPPPPPAGRPRGWDRVFEWLTDLGIARGDGWIGGVCAGLAARIGIDPVIVRGVFVVAALFGLPMFLVYGIAWALLPDILGRIHLRDLLARRFDPAMVGIGLMLLVGLFPVVPWFFAAALPFGPFFDWSPWGAFWTLFAVAAIGGVIFLIARSSSHRAPTSGVAPVTDPRTASADPSDSGEPAQDHSGVRATADPASADDSASSTAGSALTPPPAEPSAPLSAADAEVVAWREQHAAWKHHDHAWRRQQQDAERAAREQARAERAAAAGVFAVEAAERRRIHRASNPRTSFGYVVFAMGAALVIGAITSLWRGAVEPGEPMITVASGLFASALVVAISMIVAGAIRRRSGFLAFLAVALLIAGTATAAVPVARGIVFGDTSVSSWEPRDVTQVWGHLFIDVGDVGDADGAAPDPIRIDKRSGSTSIWVGAGVILTLQVTSPGGVQWSTNDDRTGEVIADGEWDGAELADGRTVVRERIDNARPGSDIPPTRQTVILDQQSGTVSVDIYQP
ncbi:PspC domain-containing protein [Microbacterium sulfonylureivorans]|uniref:PspC domain-containing protein n=1 Tax=Microbacterium sulfonylureivorans TaxID=2486854 RepID=UPI000FDCA51C|nr:PspC domain-containing protein [Microbacterium sulfonylureivorans]